MNTKLLGAYGEKIATTYLQQKKKYHILCRNYQTRTGEIDIIAQDKDILVFIEVKTRRSCTCGLPMEAVSLQKQRQITKTAICYLQAHEQWEMSCRFDVIEIFPLLPLNQQIHHIQHAFIPCF